MAASSAAVGPAQPALWNAALMRSLKLLVAIGYPGAPACARKHGALAFEPFGVDQRRGGQLRRSPRCPPRSRTARRGPARRAVGWRCGRTSTAASILAAVSSTTALCVSAPLGSEITRPLARSFSSSAVISSGRSRHVFCKSLTESGRPSRAASVRTSARGHPARPGAPPASSRSRVSSGAAARC